jgi:hypothetical protein
MKTFLVLAKTLPSFASAYAAGRARRPALAPYPAAGDVRAAVRKDPPLSYAERGAIVHALITEDRESGHQLWQTLLLLCFEPMLTRRRARMGKRGDEDRDQLILLSFLEAVKAYPLHADPAFAAHALRLGTEDALSTNTRRTGERLDAVPFDESLHGYDVIAWHRPGDAASREVERVLAQGGEEADVLRLVVETSLEGQTLQEYVEETFATLPPAHRARTYLRLSRARQRVLGELRTRITARKRAA